MDIQSGDELSNWAAALRNLVPEYYAPDRQTFMDLSSSGAFSRLLGRELPPLDIPEGAPFDRTSSIDDVRSTFIGRILYRIMLFGAKR